MTTVGAAEDAAIIEQITGLIDQVDGKTAELRDNVTRLSGQLPEPARQQTLTALEDFALELEQLFHALRNMVTHWGSPSALWDAADGWSSRVGGPVSARAGVATSGHLRADDGNWEGTAATAYAQRLELQRAALVAINTPLCESIGSALSALAVGIMTYWASLVYALSALVTGLVGAVAASGTVVGLPAAPVIAVAAVVAAFLAVIAGSVVLSSVASSTNSSLVQALNNNIDFPDGQWPRATDVPS
ncbi:hypothetical protein [Plantactinospora sp. CA-290183]|uniref:hypothetical protein n=1 Tax=Plantactinospora sp. CA-290183 TaxID=3240006 RepID=UPI003D939683